MLKCDNCGHEFEEDELMEMCDTYESVYGVSRDFPDQHYFTYDACPYCGSTDYDYVDEDEDEDEEEFLDEEESEPNGK